MKYRTLGTGLQVSALGLGCMPMVGTGAVHYGRANADECIATIHRAIDLGVTFFDTAAVYGPFTNETLLGRAIKGRRDGLVVATKCGFRTNADGVSVMDSTPATVRAVCEGSLRRLGIDVIDLFYQHRVDRGVPIEDTVGALAELVKEGKVRWLGLSEAGAATLRRAAAVHPIAALQSEYSLWERHVEAEILPVARELGIGFVPYSPLGRGFLTGRITRRSDLADGDYRTQDPRFAADNLPRNLAILETVAAIARAHDASPARVALAWLLAQGDDVVPIPGSKRRVTLEDSMAAIDLELTLEDLVALEQAAPRGATWGPRYAGAYARMVED